MQFLQTAWDKIVKVAVMLGGFLAGWMSGWGAPMKVLLAFMVADYLSGWMVAWMGKSVKTEGGGLDSNIGFNGLLKKGMILLVVLVASLLDMVIGGDAAAFHTMACWFYIANEGLSILENTALAGLPWPDGVKRALEQMKEKEKTEG